MGALSKLEAAGIEVVMIFHRNHHLKKHIIHVATSLQVVTSLSRSYRRLVAAIGINDAPKDKLKYLIHCWLSGQSVRPATWRSLHDILRELDLEELSQQIEDYLTGANFSETWEVIVQLG